MSKIPVLIVGGGPVGLALAGEFGWRGIPCMLIEQGDGTIVTPKMNEVNVRTMEFCRRWGIAGEVHACPFPPDYPLDVAFVTSLSGYELARMPRPPRMHQQPEPYSPMRLQVCSQMWFDPILQRFARSFPHVSLRYGARLESFEDRGDSVRIRLTDLATGELQEIEADYLVACDGANSMVRRTLGIGLTGDGTLGHPVHLYFRAPDLLKICGQKPTTFFVTIDRGGAWSNVRIVDPENAMWRLMVLDTDGSLTPETVDREGYLRRALGMSLEVEWLGTNIWTRRSVVAEKYSSGRVFLAGDAVHQLSPTGALGMNTGIGDAVDLGWKLAAVLEGWGGPHLLKSYDAERRPVGIRNVSSTAGFYLEHKELGPDIDLIEEDSEAGESARKRIGDALVSRIGRMFRTIGLQVGYSYENSPICVPDGTPPIENDTDEFVASARPGSRAPHAWLPDGSSVLDLFGREFVLLQLARQPPDISRMQDAAASRGMPLKAISMHEPELVRLYEYPLVLIRPDGHVAWRGQQVPEDCLPLVDKVRGAYS